ncbi:MAG TPA: ATP-binding protein [Marinobacter sp.]|nr:ATP-binding protein [Marinobacter sp.]
MQRILLNLLDNAAKYTQQGDISLSITFNDSPDHEPSLAFCVRDTGCGIAPHHLEKIYTPFYQASENNPGAGLGLAICFELAETLGGSLHLESEVGDGTTATFTLPYTPGDEQLAIHSLPALQSLLPAFDAQGQGALIVEDSPGISEILDSELTDMGFEVELFGSAEDFMKAATSRDNAPAVIITDYNLPGASGSVVLQAGRTQWPGVPVILLSATQSRNLAPSGEHSERYSAYLSKPIDLLGLRLKLVELCDLITQS